MNWFKSKSAFRAAVLAAVLPLLAGCFSDPNPNKRFVFPDEPPSPPTVPGPAPVLVASNQSLPPGGAPGPDYTKARVGDLLTVSFSDLPPPGILEQRIRIPADGMVTLPYNVQINAVGKTTGELQTEIRNRYVPDYYVNLTVNVKTEERFYYVDGEVKIPSRQPYLGEMTVMRAIASAGGFTEFANKRNIELRRANGETLRINSSKVRNNPKLDPQVFPNDQIVVPKKIL